MDTPAGEVRNTFGNSGTVAIQAGQQIVHGNINIHQNESNLLALLPHVAQATFDSYKNQHDPVCLQGTRVDVLNQIMAWADGYGGKRIFWLNGMAGTGKSTIARTVAYHYSEQKRLGASFFFSRDGGDVGHAGKFFTTIAWQLAKVSSSLKGFICDAIAEHNDIASQSLRNQWRQLVYKPLSRLGSNFRGSPLLFVVDALDECANDNEIKTIVQLFAEARSLETVDLHIFLTSRPDIPSQTCFCRIPDEHQDFILHDISRSVVDRDISIFLEDSFKLIRQERALPAEWPGEQTIQHMIRKSSGLFIWAATACRFVREGGRLAAKRLSMILQDDTSAIAPEKQLNQIYLTVLKSLIRNEYNDQEKEDTYNILGKVLGSIATLFAPLPSNSLARLLHVPEEDVNQTLADLHAILVIPKDQSCAIRLNHPSFRDFLLDKDRCGNSPFWVDEKQAHRASADNCIRLMSTSLKRDICGLHTDGALTTDVDSDRRGQCISLELQYACLYWVQHLQRSGAQLYDNHQVHQFLREHSLHWLESLSWMQKISEGILAITSLESIALANECSSLYTFIHDVKRVALYSRSAIEQAPLQIYCSALVFAPAMSIVRQQFEDQMPPWIQRLPKVQQDWSGSIQTFEGHSSPVNTVAFSPDGNQLASASDNGTVRLWDVATGAACQMLEGHSLSANAVVFSPNGSQLASASDDWRVRLWDAATGALRQTLRGHTGSVSAVAFSPDGSQLASASDDWTVKLWDATTEVAHQTLRGHSGSVKAVAFSPDGSQLASASDDRTVKLWDAATGTARQTLRGHSRSVNVIAFSPDGSQLASVSDDVTLWDVATGAVCQTLRGHSSWVKTVAFSPDGSQLASGSDDWTVKLWDAATGTARQTLGGHSGSVKAVAFSPDGSQLASASDDRTVKLWDAVAGVVWQTLKGHSPSLSVKAIVFSPDGSQLASASALDDCTVKLWDAVTGAVRQTLRGHSSWVKVVAFSPDASQLASASSDETIKLWDAATGAARQTLRGHSGSVNVIAFSPDGSRLASVSDDVKLWDVATGAVCQTLRGHFGWVKTVAFSPDGSQLASASGDLTVRLWDVATGAVCQRFNGHYRSVQAVAFSPDGSQLASASDDRTVKLWDAVTGAARQTLKGHSSLVRAVAFSPDGSQLASASYDHTVRLWDVATGAARQTLKVNAAIQTLLFSSDGSYLETDRGPVNITPSLAGTAPPQPSFLRGIFVKEQWIARGTENLLWLPPDYRATSAAVRGNTVFLGHASGHVSMFEFDF